MAQKIITIGSSVGVTLPKDVLEKVDFKVGDAIELSINEDERSISIIPSQRKNRVQIDPSLAAWTDSFINENRELLERLSKQ